MSACINRKISKISVSGHPAFEMTEEVRKKELELWRKRGRALGVNEKNGAIVT